ncbi:MAG TPA: hypothetical protein PK816_11335, partial [Candidatus Cloacimonadota bacterium]|nr:hypothetical protein [Candidatus Cloacimonadota bacterium]
IKRMNIIGCIFLINLLFFSCENPNNDDINSNSDDPDPLTAPSLTLYSQASGEVFFMLPIDTISVGETPIEYWVYYNTDGSDTKNYYGILSSDHTISGLRSGMTVTFFVRKYRDGSFGPFSNKESIQVR